MHLPDATAAALRRDMMVSPVIMPLLVEGREVVVPPPPSSLPPKLFVTGNFLKEGALLRRMVGRDCSTAKGVMCRVGLVMCLCGGNVREGGAGGGGVRRNEEERGGGRRSMHDEEAGFRGKTCNLRALSQVRRNIRKSLVCMVRLDSRLPLSLPISGDFMSMKVRSEGGKGRRGGWRFLFHFFSAPLTHHIRITMTTSTTIRLTPVR
jgi:hypothetical protein